MLPSRDKISVMNLIQKFCTVTSYFVLLHQGWCHREQSALHRRKLLSAHTQLRLVALWLMFSFFFSSLQQNNLSNPPTPPASLPPTPPPVARQKLLNGFATTEELASKAAGGHDGEASHQFFTTDLHDTVDTCQKKDFLSLINMFSMSYNVFIFSIFKIFIWYRGINKYSPWYAWWQSLLS